MVARETVAIQLECGGAVVTGSLSSDDDEQWQCGDWVSGPVPSGGRFGRKVLLKCSMVASLSGVGRCVGDVGFAVWW